MNLYVVESPLQLLCAYEAICREKNGDYELLIRQTGRGLNDKHLITCVKYLGLEYSVFWLFPDRIKLGIVKNIPLWFRIWRTNYQEVYFGSIYSLALSFISKIIRTRKIQYLDDGAATIRAQAEMIDGKRIIKNWFTFFNITPLSGQIVTRHKFEYLSKLVSTRGYNGSYFIGQPVEIMKGINKEEYVWVIKKLAKNYSQDEPLIYIPHRVEDCTMLENQKNIRILRLDVPIELYFINSKEELPKEIYSFYSTALVSLKSLFPETSAFSIKASSQKLTNYGLDAVYGYLAENEISVVEY